MRDENDENEDYRELGLAEYFPLPSPREKQIRAIEYIQKKYDEGFRDIVIAAPTGIGKTGIGATVCYWAEQANLPGAPGGYYLVTQKLLQDQIERDFPRFKKEFVPGVSLKSATEYECPVHGDCGSGAVAPKGKGCNYRRIDQCAYICQRNKFIGATLACTNYPYIFTEHWNVGALPARRVAILDECHTVERQILGFIELSLSEEVIAEWTGRIKYLPVLSTKLEFTSWVERFYLPELFKKLKDITALVEGDGDPKTLKMKVKLSTHIAKIVVSVDLIKAQPDNWVYWQENDKNGALVSVAKPLDAAPFVPKMINELADLRIYMSAFPGSKRVFSRSLGIPPEKLAWLNLNSTFPIENRPILLMPLGSMSKNNVDYTLPAVLRMSEKIFSAHANQKGIIHCHTYKLGTAFYNHFIGTTHGFRLIFPKKCFRKRRSLQESPFQHRSYHPYQSIHD